MDDQGSSENPSEDSPEKNPQGTATTSQISQSWPTNPAPTTTGRGGGSNASSSNFNQNSGTTISGSKLRINRLTSPKANRIKIDSTASSFRDARLALMMNQNKLASQNLKDMNNSRNNNRGQRRRGGQASNSSIPRSSSLGGPSTGSSGNQGKSRRKQSLFSRLKNSFGKYLGLPTSSRRSGRYGSADSRYNQNRYKSHKKQKKTVHLKNPEDILRERFYSGLNNLNRRRGVANKLEFESPDTPLFQKICKLYNKYTLDNNIPDGNYYCPKK